MLCPFKEHNYCVASDYFPAKYFPNENRLDYSECTKAWCPFVKKETYAFVDCEDIEKMLWSN